MVLTMCQMKEFSVTEPMINWGHHELLTSVINLTIMELKDEQI